MEVTLAYGYSKGETDVDGASTAVYVVKKEGTERVRGDDVSPC
ncbi:hypothetical protein [Halorussus amylolyticus]|nr:hypothetical protein [Halorussus amylolyticus]